MRRISIPTIIIVALIAIGIFANIKNLNFSAFIVPVLLIVLALVIFKYPPSSWRAANPNKRKNMTDEQRYKEAVKRQKQQMKNQMNTTNTKGSSHTKTLPFKVIDGGRDDNDTPRYH